jgi:hypothetical protein
MSSKFSFVSVLATAGKLTLLTGIMFVLFSVTMTITGVANDPSLAGEASSAVDQDSTVGVPEVASAPGSSPSDPADQGRLALIFLGICFLQTLALSSAILRSRWRGWRLVLTIFTVMFVVSAVLSQVESLFFIPEMSRALIARLVLSSAVVAAAFSMLAVWILGRLRSSGEITPPSKIGPHSMRRWSAILLGLAVLHIVIYFVFGYYVAWQSPDLRAFYGGEDPGSFWLQMASVVRDTPWMMPLQVVRGLLWGLMAVVLASGLTGSRWSAALTTAGVFVALFSLPLLLPNPLMPEAVRQAHLVETFLSRGLYGLIAVWLLTSPLHLARVEPEAVRP